MAPTRKGREFADVARAVVEKFDDSIKEYLDDHRKPSVVRVGVSPGWLIGPGLDCLLKGLARVDVEKAQFVATGEAEAQSLVLSNELDFAAIALFGACPTNLNFVSLGELKFFATARNLELARRAASLSGSNGEQKFIGTADMAYFDKVIYESYVDATMSAPIVNFRTSSIDITKGLIEECDDVCVFLSTNKERAESYFGRECYPVSWINKVVNFGILSKKTNYIHIDWKTFIEYCERSIIKSRQGNLTS